MRGSIFLQGLISFLIVAFGQPSFAPWLGPVSAALGYALFWRAIRKFPFFLQKFWRSFVWYGSVSLVQLSWMSSIEFQGLYMLLVWVSLSIWLGVQFGLLSILIPYNRPLKMARILAIASLWTLIEWGRLYFICGYTWNPAGLALSESHAIQLASVFGVFGLSFWVIFSNLMGLRAFLRRGINNYIIWAAVVVMPYTFGMLHLTYHEKKAAKNHETLGCTLVQPGLLPSEKHLLGGKIRSFISPYDQWRRVLTLLRETKETELIVLPESVVPFHSGASIYDERKVKEIFTSVLPGVTSKIFPDPKEPKVSNSYWVQTLSNYFNADVIVGLDHIDQIGEAHNSAFFARPYQERMERYDKRVLMPLAEYLPFRRLAPLVKNYGITDFFSPGLKATLFQGKIPISVSICYEETFPEKVREGRKNGAKLLVNVSNDGWYPNSLLPKQHFSLARFRAIENGAPLIRSCNTGRTAALNSFGQTVGKIDLQVAKKKIKSGTLNAKINTYSYSTPFLIWGNRGIVGLSILFLLFFLIFKPIYKW